MNGVGGSLADLRHRNRQAMCRALLFECLSRAQVARELGLTRAAVSQHVEEMLAEGFVREVGTTLGKRGRSAVLLDIVPSYGCFGGLYINRTGLWVGAVDMKGSILFAEALPLTDPDVSTELAAERLFAGLEARGIPREKLLGLGVSSPGPLDEENGQILTPPGFEAWHSYPLAQRMWEALGVPAQLENNATSYTHAELLFGMGQSVRDFVFLIVDSGISGGVVLGGQLLRTRGSGVELGHTSIEAAGRPCACGNRGCLERYAAVPELLMDHFPSGGVTSWAQLAEGAEKGDEACTRAVEQEAEYLAVTLTSSVNVFEPECVVLSGDICRKPELLLKLIEEKIAARAIMRGRRRVDVAASTLGPDSQVRAAASAALGKFYGV